jgi:hypothetical protein
MLRRVVLAAIPTAFALLLATATPATASAPIVNEHERFTETFDDEVCGISGTSTLIAVDNFRLYADGTFTDTSVFQARLHRRER